MIHVLLATLLSTLPTNAEHVNKSMATLGIQRIELNSTWNGLGAGRFYHAIIERQHNRLQLDGRVPSWWIVRDLLDALDATPLPTPTISTFPFGQQDETVRDTLRRCIGDAADLPPVMQMYSQMFYTSDNQEQFLSRYFSGKMWHTDDYPTERVEVTFVDGSKIAAESDSQGQYMLPFTITKNGLTYKTFDPAVPVAIARLSPADVNYERLRGSGFFADYGKALCSSDGDKLNAEVIEAFTPAIAHYVKEQQLAIGPLLELRLAPDLGSLDGEVHFPEWPTGLTFYISADGLPLDAAATQAAGLNALRNARTDGSRIATLPWVSTWFKRTDGASIRLSHLSSSPFLLASQTIDELRRHSPRIYSIVAAIQDTVLCGQLWDKKSRFGSDWLFLPDGRSVLVEFHATESTLAIVSAANITSWSAFAKDENNATFEWRATATVVNDKGVVVEP